MSRSLFNQIVSVVIVLSFMFSNIVFAEGINRIQNVCDNENLAARTDTAPAAAALQAIEATVGQSGKNDAELIEKRDAVVLENKLTTPLNAKGNADMSRGFTQGGYNQKGFGVPERASIDGSHSKGKGSQGYYVDGGKEIFLAIVQQMKDFFKKREQRLGKPNRYIIKCGIGGQHTPFQGIANVFSVMDKDTGLIVGEYELGKDFEESIDTALKSLGAGWDQVAVIPSSKSGSTDETMVVFVQVLSVLLEKIGDIKIGEGNGKSFAKTVFAILHEVNFLDGKERPGADLFEMQEGKNLIDLVAERSGIDREKIKEVFAIVLGNMFFETTDNPKESRLAAFIKNSGLDKELGDDKPGFGAMFDNVGGRWTGDLHMMTFLAFYNLDEEQYWSSRNEGIRAVRAGTHRGNVLGNKILDEEITDIALVVPEEFFWFGKSIEQNFNESIWQDGFANLVTVKKSKWDKQARYYRGKGKLVINLTELNLDSAQYNEFKLQVPQLKGLNKQDLAMVFADLFTTFYGMTNTVGTRLIVRALKAAGKTVNDVDLDNLDNEATKIVQANLFVRQPYVELGKKLLEEQLGKLQAEERKTKGAIVKRYGEVLEAAQRMEINAWVDGIDAESFESNWDSLAATIRQAADYAQKTGRKFVPFVYLEGGRFYDLRDYLVDLGIEWVMQGTGDQHISYQQVLAQPKKYLPFIISFVPETPAEGLPAIGFAKGYLDNVSPHMVRDAFAEASYTALTEGRKEQGGKGLFMRLVDSDDNIAKLRDAFTSVFKFMPKGDNYDAWIEKAEQLKPEDLNMDMFRDYDYRSTGPTFKPEMAFLFGLVWADMAIAKAESAGITNRTVLLARDAREIEPELVDALVSALRYRGLNVVYMAADDPNCVTSYSWGVQQVKPLMSIFITASHVSQPKDIIVRGFKVAMLNKKGGNILSLSTKEIKKDSLPAMKSLIANLSQLRTKKAEKEGAFTPINVDKNVVRMNAVLGRIVSASESLYEFGETLKAADDPLVTLGEYESKYGASSKPLVGMKIVIEGYNTPSGRLAAETFKTLGANVVLLNGDIKEVSGLHNADPSINANLKEVQDKIVSENADFGMAFDLDGDRGAIIVPVRFRTSPYIRFEILAPDNLIVMLLPSLVKKWGYDVQTIGKKIGVIKDVLGTYGVKDVADSLGVEFSQTDAGYVFLKARKEEMEPQGYTFPVYGERSGHTWLHATGEIENPVALGVLFAVLVKQQMNDYFERREMGTLLESDTLNPASDIYAKNTISYFQSPRFQPLFHPDLLKMLGEDSQNTTEWRFNPAKPTSAPQAIIGLGRDYTVKELAREFVIGKEYSTPIGILKVKDFVTYQDTPDLGGLYRFADIVFEINGRFAGRFVFRASSNDPSFVCSYESPAWEEENFEDGIKRRAATAGVVLKFLIEKKIAVVTKDVLREFIPADRVQTVYDKANLGPVEHDYTAFRGEAKGSYLTRARSEGEEEIAVVSYPVNDDFRINASSGDSKAEAINYALARLADIYGNGVLIRLKGKEIQIVKNLNGGELYSQGRAPMASYDGNVFKIDELLFTYPIGGVDEAKAAKYRLYVVFDQVLHESWESIGDIIPNNPHILSDIVATLRNVRMFLNPNHEVSNADYRADEEEYREAMLSMLRGENPIDADHDYLELLTTIQKLDPKDRTEDRIRKLVVRYAMKTKVYEGVDREKLGSLAKVESDVAALDKLLDSIVASFNRILGVQEGEETAIERVQTAEDVSLSVVKTFKGFVVKGAEDLSDTVQRLIAVSADQIYKTDRLARDLKPLDKPKYLLARENRLKELEAAIGSTEYNAIVEKLKDNKYIICTDATLPAVVSQDNVIEMIDPFDLEDTAKVSGRHYLPIPLSRSTLYMAAAIARVNGDVAQLDPMVKGFIRNFYAVILGRDVTDPDMKQLISNPWWCLPSIRNVLSELNTLRMAVHKIEQAA
jgi:phosphomannomutase